MFTIEPITKQSDFEQVLALQNLIFGESPYTHLQMPTLMSYAHNGSLVIGAFDEGQLFGFAVAYLGTDVADPNRPAMANLKLVLDRLAIHPDYRNSGLGTQLMMNIRYTAMKQAIRMLTTAFSPLNGRMAYLLTRKLGAIIRDYVPSYYGVDMDWLSRDQLVADWWLTNNRAEEKLFGQRKPLTLQQYLDVQVPIINPTDTLENGLPIPYEKDIAVDGDTMLLIEIPTDYINLQFRDSFLAQTWCNHSRKIFETVFMTGYVATDFLYGKYEGRMRSFYLMSYDGPRFSFDADDADEETLT